jgi:hypothetical protein
MNTNTGCKHKNSVLKSQHKQMHEIKNIFEKRPHPRALQPIAGAARLLIDNDTPFNIWSCPTALHLSLGVMGLQ